MHGIVPHKRLCIKLLVVLILTLVLAGQIYVHTTYATPAAPVLLVNHTLKQCIDQVILADECYYCKPAEGWEILQAGQCPSGYTTIPRQTITDIPVNCVSYPTNDWAACSWRTYPTVTPESISLTAQHSGEFLPTSSAAPGASAVDRFSSDPLPLSILCMLFVIGITITSIVLMMIRRKKVLPRNKSKGRDRT
jgi:hypothetical protein